MTVAAMLEGPLAWLVVTAFMAGITNGAAYGVQRALLNYLTTPDKLPRALGVAATLNEITFALSPVLASALGAISPVVAMIALTILGVGPLLLMPSIPEAEAEPEPAGAKRSALPPDVHIWLFCAAAGSAVVAGLEIGAVPFAIRFGLAPTWGFLFALALCVGSVAGGVWVSVRNRILTRAQVVLVLGITAAAAALAALSPRVALTLTAAFFIGLWLPLLGTYYSLVLDELSPPERRTEVFALMRTFNAVGIIIVSGVLALFGLELALMVSVIGIAACTVAVSLRFFGRNAPR
jgi:MFS family permease